MLHFLLPSDPLAPKEPDDLFRQQAQALRGLGAPAALWRGEG